MKSNPGRVLVGDGGVVNPGNNDAAVLAQGKNGKGVGELPGHNAPYMSVATENTDPMQKHEKVDGIVG